MNRHTPDQTSPHQTTPSATEAPQVVDPPNVSDALTRRLPSLSIDLEDPLERASFGLVHQSVQDALDRSLFDSPLSEASKTQYRSSIAVFKTWCATRQDPIEPLTLSQAARVSVVATFLTWLASDVTDDDAAVGNGTGLRWRRTALKGKSIRVYTSALRWWAQQQGIDDPVPSEAAKDLIAERLNSAPDRQAVPLSKNDVKTMLAAVRLGPGARKQHWGCPMERVEPWVAGNTAGLLVQFCGGLRISERLRLRDEWVTVGEDRLTLRLPSTKARHDGRSVDLFGDPDIEFCPVRAILHWLEVAERHGIDRQGLLLPTVTSFKVRPDADRHLAQWVFKQIATNAGLAEGIDAERQYVGTHSLRRGRATSLAAAGMDIEQLRRLLGHVKAVSTIGYVDRAAIAATDWSEELGL
jgi:integrase